VRGVFGLPVLSSDEGVLARPVKASLFAVWPIGRMDPHTLESTFPAGTVATEPAEQNDLSTHFPKQRDPVLQEPHAHTSRSRLYFFVNESRKVRRRGGCEVFLLDRHNNCFSARGGVGQEVIYLRQNLLEQDFLGKPSMVGRQPFFHDGEADVYDSNSRL
jgi:hypothetical protein